MGDDSTPKLLDADLEPGSERRAADRRCNSRRAPQRPFDPLFAATLVNHIAKPETHYLQDYPTLAPKLRAGLVLNIRL